MSARKSEPDPRFADWPEMDRPEVLFGELTEELRHAFENRPRTLQTELGASSLGTECIRQLICECGGLREPADSRGSTVNFKAEVGVMMHAGLQQIVEASPLNHGPEGRRFLTELPLQIGTIAGRPLIGNIDLYDRLGAAVWDWKTKSKTQLLEHRRHGLGPRYTVQVQAYGLGVHLLGLPVRTVGAIFLPRDGEFTECFYLAEPFDPEVARRAIVRADGIARMVGQIGVDATIEAYGSPICDDRWCRWCPAPRKYRAAAPIDPSADPLAVESPRKRKALA